MSAERYPASWGVGGLTTPVYFNRVYDGSGYPDQPGKQVAAYRDSDIRIEALDLTRVTVEDYRELRQFLEGADLNESFEGVLVATMDGVIHGSSHGDLEDKAWLMRAAFSPAVCRIASVSLDPPGLLPLDFSVDTPEAAGVPVPSARRLYAKPSIGRPIIVGRARSGKSRRFRLQLVGQPAVFSQTLHQQAVVLAGQNVTNAGSAVSRGKIRITFNGAGNAALTITNTTTGKAFVINATTAANNEVWILDVERSKLYRSSDSADRFSQRVSGWLSDLWLPVGVSNWVVTNTGGVASVRIDFRDAWA